MNKAKKWLAHVLALAMVISSISVLSFGQQTKSEAASGSFQNLNQSQFVSAMGAGWNLGNQLEAANNGVPSETAWGNPTITENLIKAVKNAGFTSIRIPVSYMGHIGSDSNYTVDASWLNRVQQVVDMCVNNGLYAIINMHGDGYTTLDGGWLFCGSSNQTAIKAKYKAVWKQIATKFKNYDQHLVFESMNEEFDGTYGTPSSTAYANINAYNQIFVDTVRQTGGNNAKRWLMIPGWNTNITYTVGNYGFSLPTDNYRDRSISTPRIMISVHYYDPWDFCGEESSNVTQWGDTATNSAKTSSWGDESALKSQFSSLYNKFVAAGYPVVIGEYGSIDKSAYDSTSAAQRAEFAKKVCTYAKKYGMVPVLWDNGYTGTYGFGVIDRSTCKVTQQKIIDAIASVYPKSSNSNSSSSSNSSNSSASSLEGTYYIKSSFSGLYLDVANGSASNNANVQQYTYTGTDRQKFKLVKDSATGYYYIYTGASGYSKVVDVAGKSAADGANILQYSYKGSNNQLFDIQKISNGAYAIKTRVTSSASCLDVYNWSTAAGGNIAQYSYWGGACQLWILEKASDTKGTDISLSANDLTYGNYTNAITSGSFTIGASSGKNVAVLNRNTTVNGTSYSKVLQMNGGGNSTGRYIKFTATGACTVKVTAASTSTSASRTVRLASGSVGGNTVGNATITGTPSTVTYKIPSAGTYYLYSTGSGIYVYQVNVAY